MVFKLKVAEAPEFLFRFFYFISKINGLLPITISFEPLSASRSFTDQFYSTLFTLILIVSVPWAQWIVIQFMGIFDNQKETIILVFLLQVACSAVRIGAIYLSQIFNSETLSNFFNRSVQIHEMFAKGKTWNPFFDSKLSTRCLSKFISAIFQFVFMIVSSPGFILVTRSSENFLLLLASFTLILYSHMVMTLSTGIYFSGMIVLGQFYKNLNRRISNLNRKISILRSKSNGVPVGMQMFCNMSDELDELTDLYRDITNHARSFSKYQRCFKLFSLTQYFVILLAEVCILNSWMTL